VAASSVNTVGDMTTRVAGQILHRSGSVYDRNVTAGGGAGGGSAWPKEVPRA